MTITQLAKRRCYLRESDHVYCWKPTGEEMAISTTGVVNHDKPPYDGPEEASWRGSHVHRCMEAMANGSKPPDEVSPEGVDCAEWFNQLTEMAFWSQIDTIAAEYTMVHTGKSLGGQCDLICHYKGKNLLVDLKTKGASWTSASRKDRQTYKAQMGGYLYLLSNGDDHHGGIWIDEVRILVVTPKQVKWLSAMDPDDCYKAWEKSWDAYCAYLAANPF